MDETDILSSTVAEIPRRLRWMDTLSSTIAEIPLEGLDRWTLSSNIAEISKRRAMWTIGSLKSEYEHQTHLRKFLRYGVLLSYVMW